MSILRMSNSEIAREYRLARNKKTEIVILADLNGCTAAEIKEILLEEGCEMPLPKKAQLEVERKLKALEAERAKLRELPEPKEDEADDSHSDRCYIRKTLDERRSEQMAVSDFVRRVSLNGITGRY